MIPNISPETNQHYLNNPVDYVQDFLTINGKPLYPYKYQQPVLNAMLQMESHLPDQKRIMAVLGARQIFGKSTTASMVTSWFAPLHDNSEIIIISHRQRRSDKMIFKIKKYFTSNPILKEMTRQGGHTDLVWSASEIELTNGSFLTSLPEGNDADSAVGDSTNLVVIDEVARFKNADSIKASIMPTVFESMGIILMFSSSWGRGGRGEYWSEVIRNEDYELKFEANAYEALEVQRQRNILLKGEHEAEIIYQKKLKWLEFQKRELGRYLFEMQYMNSFEYGLENVFDKEDLNVCFSNIPQLIEPVLNRRYILVVDYGKSVKTGDRTVLSVYDITDLSIISCVYRQPYSILYRDVLPKIKDAAILFNVETIYCDLGGGEAQVESLDIDIELRKCGINTVGVFFSGGMKQTTSDFIDKGITRKTINKYQCATRLVSYIENHKIRYCRDAMKDEYDDYLIVKTPSGLKSYKHPPNGHDDAIDTDIILMGIVSEMIQPSNLYSAYTYSDNIRFIPNSNDSIIAF